MTLRLSKETLRLLSSNEMAFVVGASCHGGPTCIPHDVQTQTCPTRICFSKNVCKNTDLCNSKNECKKNTLVGCETLVGCDVATKKCEPEKTKKDCAPAVTQVC